MSYDPLIAAFNTLAFPLDEQPTTLAEMAAMAPELDGKIGTVNVDERQRRARHVRLHRRLRRGGLGGARAARPALRASRTAPARCSASCRAASTIASFFASGSLRALIDTTETGDLLNYRYLADATTLPARAVGVTTAAASPNAAQVFVNYILSEEGQTATCLGGFTPYREGVDCPTGLPAVEAAVGEGNAILVGYPADLREQQAAIEERWNAAFGR